MLPSLLSLEHLRGYSKIAIFHDIYALKKNVDALRPFDALLNKIKELRNGKKINAVFLSVGNLGLDKENLRCDAGHRAENLMQYKLKFVAKIRIYLVYVPKRIVRCKSSNYFFSPSL